MLGAVPVPAPGFAAIATDRTRGIPHAPVDAGVDEIVTIIDFGYRD